MLVPRIEHIYQSHQLNSTHWERFVARDDDIVDATSVKSGTTWMQNIVRHLIFPDPETRPGLEVSPWIDSAVTRINEAVTMLEAQQHRRFVKTHLPLDGLPYYAQVKYIVVTRDARDVFMSLWNHYRNFTPEWIERLNRIPAHVDRPFPPCPDDIHNFWREWMTRGWFEWESEGYPWWSNLRHTQTWWNFRHLPNILFVHFNDLLTNPADEIRRVVEYLNIDLPDERLPLIVDAVSFSSMKQNGEQIIGTMSATKGGAHTFFNSGTNGRWRGVLTDDDLELYEAAVARELTPDCAHWLEHGRLSDR